MNIVIALGGNALGNTLPEQMQAVQTTAKTIADLIEAGHQLIITHGNGPQVGMLHLAMTELSRQHVDHPPAPISVCTAMSQGYIGYDLQNALREELETRGIGRGVATILTQVEVDPDDPAFQTPTKPIGAFMSKEEADEMAARGNAVMEDAGRGYRRVVASPRPKRIVEIETVKAMIAAGQVPICCGGGGIPVARQGAHLRGMGAVIDKDFAAALLAEQVNADMLIILTAVEKVAINFGKENETWLDEMSVEQAQQYLDEGHFAPGSMAPKVEAAMRFAAGKPGRQALITLLQKAEEGVEGKTGTRICN